MSETNRRDGVSKNQGANMRKTAGLCFLILSSIFATAISGWSQEVLSTPAKAAWKFADGKTIAAAYSSPRMRGRKIFGNLVPFGEVWRPGADNATSFVTNTDLVVSGKNVSAGSYTLLSFPTQHNVTLIISKQTGEFGIPYPGEKFDFARDRK